MNKQQEHISKFISLILRHKPETIGITLDTHGWANVAELIDGMKYNGKTVELSDLVIVVVEDSKGRYSFNEDRTKIRANQGHSIDGIDLELEIVNGRNLPLWLYHGTNSIFVEIIKQEGLKPMGRNHVHLSEDIETANAVGNRRLKNDTETHIFKISTVEALNDGIVFYKSKNGVYLTEAIPAWLLR
jgi:putative RNA 2'-phosphotransferase